MTAIYFNSFSLENRIEENHFHILIVFSNKKTNLSRVIFNKAIPVPVVVVAAILLSPVLLTLLALILVLGLVSSVASLLSPEIKEPSYEDASRYFVSGKGYLNNLSEDEKSKLLAKKGTSLY